MKNDNINKENIFKTGNKTWEPKQIQYTVSTFLESFKNSFTRSLDEERKKPTINLTTNETFENLIIRDDIVICNVEDCIKEANKQLDDMTFYKQLSHDPTRLHVELIN